LTRQEVADLRAEDRHADLMKQGLPLNVQHSMIKATRECIRKQRMHTCS
jgi:hypothetical protein